MMFMQILRLLFAICTAPIKHLVYPPIFQIFVTFSNFLWDDCNTQVEIETKGMQFFAGWWRQQIRFILGDVQIDKLNFQNIFFIFRSVTTLKFKYNIENLSVNSRSLRAFYWHLLIFFTWKCTWFLILNYLLFC